MQTNSSEAESKESPVRESETTVSLKRPFPSSPSTETNNTKTNVASSAQTQSKPDESHESTVVDIAQAISLEPGSRIEVQWDLHFDDGAELDETEITEGGTGVNANNDMKQTRWWGGTLLHPDTRMHTLQDGEDEVAVPIRVIDYDPYIEGGFPDRSLEDVCFLSDHSLLNHTSDSRAYWRKEGDQWEPNSDMDDEERDIMATPGGAADNSDDDISVSSTSKEDALRVVLDTVLQSAMQKAGIMNKMMKLEASQQSAMAEKIAQAKQKLTEKLLEQLNGNDGDNSNGGGLETVITTDHIKKCMEGLKNDL
jgi:hypothetical protein